jgi:hypothetical protein
MFGKNAVPPSSRYKGKSDLGKTGRIHGREDGKCVGWQTVVINVCAQAR